MRIAADADSWLSRSAHTASGLGDCPPAGRIAAVQFGTVAQVFTELLCRMAEIDYEAASQARVLVAAHLGHINDLAHQLMERQALPADQLRIVDRIIRIVGDATDVLEGV
jgi:hypothetical protein